MKHIVEITAPASAPIVIPPQTVSVIKVEVPALPGCVIIAQPQKPVIVEVTENTAPYSLVINQGPKGDIGMTGPEGPQGIPGDPAQAYTLTNIPIYNEVTNVAPGVEVVVASYTVLPGDDIFFQRANASGSNVATFTVTLNGVVQDKKYTYFTYFNIDFNFNSGVNLFPGLQLTTGDVIQVRAIQNRLDNCSFNARMQLVKVTLI